MSRLPDILLLKAWWYCCYPSSDRDLEEVSNGTRVRLSNLEHTPELPWQKLYRQRWANAIAIEDIHVVEV